MTKRNIIRVLIAVNTILLIVFLVLVLGTSKRIEKDEPVEAEEVPDSLDTAGVQRDTLVICKC